MLKDIRSSYIMLSPRMIELKMYRSFLIIPFVLFLVIYAAMFFNVENMDHIYFSMTRFYRALITVSLITPLLLFLMRAVYMNTRVNKFITFVSLFVFAATLYCMRTQSFINDRQYIEAMIPQHSSSIMISRQASIKNPKLKAVAETIIHLQEQRIHEMQSILKTMN